ncbi:alpha/beta-Hydrolases superfamily protein [Artemisia annua]|uniref:Alpha/beta-Hydrolases superfamily protein n=1 Tax=Artemisia annua TaxID=35608 RepID=A0A2U1PWW5_ARTAN|nr:alpha/beta-Hydrolases superfamily protein [Artemisia annua]
MARILKNKTVSKFLHLQRSFNNFPFTFTRSIETLAYEQVLSNDNNNKDDSNHSAFVLHGLMGSARNWRSFSKNLANSLSPSSDWKMTLVDLRNHGRSAGLSGLQPPHDMVNAANDIANLVKSQGWSWPEVVLGHSMGGKVALQYATSCARGDYGSSAKLPKQLWVLDSVPGIVDPEETSGEVEKVLETLQKLPKLIPSRKWLVDHLTNLGFSRSLSEWLGTNLKKSGEHETWAFDLDGIIQMFDSYRKMDYWPLLEHPPKGMEIVIVRAEDSDRWDSRIIQKLESLDNRKLDESEGKLTVVVLPKSGHWVHVDNPKGLLEIVTPKMASLV